MLGQRINPRRENGDLDFRGPSVYLASPELSDQLLFSLFRNGHLLPRLLHLGLLGALRGEAPSSYRGLLKLFLDTFL
jgi:hypothetical protein